jgi:uncharacterized protein YgiM (DUF1202 family)
MASTLVGKAPMGMTVFVAKETKHWLLVRINGVGDGWILS